MKEENEISNQPRIVKSHDIRIDGDYAEWIAELKHRYRSAQVKASVRVNAEKLLFNWELGRDLVQKKAEERWGAGVVEQVSLDLQREFPNADGFSTTNLWYMKQWYLFYSKDDTKLQQLVGEISSSKLQQLLQKLILKNSSNPLENFRHLLLTFHGDITSPLSLSANQLMKRCSISPKLLSKD